MPKPACAFDSASEPATPDRHASTLHRHSAMLGPLGVSGGTADESGGSSDSPTALSWTDSESNAGGPHGPDAGLVSVPTDTGPVPFTNVHASFIGQSLARQHTILAIQRQMLLKMGDMKDQLRELTKEMKEIREMLQSQQRHPIATMNPPHGKNGGRAFVKALFVHLKGAAVFKFVRASCGPHRKVQIKTALRRVWRATVWK